MSEDISTLQLPWSSLSSMILPVDTSRTTARDAAQALTPKTTLVFTFLPTAPSEFFSQNTDGSKKDIFKVQSSVCK